jgi:octaprenyl-diphosphate synthase
MSSTLSAPRPAAAASPLDDLNTRLAADMAATNDLILKRLQSPIDMIPQVAAYLIQAGGKRIRPLLTLACAQMFGPLDLRTHQLATAVEFIHSATLLHDDVVDNSETRRGQQVANLVYGNKAAILVGDFLFARAFELMVETGNLRVLDLLSHAAAVIVEGEVDQMTADDLRQVTLDRYMQIISAKTAALFAAAAAAGPALYGAAPELQNAMYQYGHHLGIAFQISDDILDYTADTATFGKQLGNDFLEGKITAPVLYALQFGGQTEHAFWQRCLVDHDIQDGDFEKAQGYLRQHDAFSKAHHLADHHQNLAVAALKDVPAHPFKAILVDLADFTVNRER